MLLRNPKSILNVLVLLILTTFLTSCGTAVKQLEIFSVKEERQPLELPAPLTPKLEEIKWTIITSENAEEVFAKLKAGNVDPIIWPNRRRL